MTYMRRSVLFDLDGTLVLANDLHFNALNEALMKYGSEPISDGDRERYEGLPSVVKMEMLGVPKGLWGSIGDLKREIHMEMVHQAVRPDERLISEIKKLSEEFFLGVVTNEAAGPAHALLNRSGLWGFMGLLIHGEFGKKKPDPELYLKALTTLRYPENPYCIAVEDNNIGVEAAERAGLRCLRVSGPSDITYERVGEMFD